MKRYRTEADIAGVDEAGRGPLAGPLVVAAVLLDPRRVPRGLDDSKQLSAARREVLFERIVERALGYRIEVIEADEIDRLNIFQATMTGMRRALEGLQPAPRLARIDGNQIPRDLKLAAEAIVGGDGCVPAISAASILAKVTRDRIMQDWHARHPDYGFDRHVGYPTPEHLRQLRRLGACPCHRRSFAPVREVLQGVPVQVELMV